MVDKIRFNIIDPRGKEEWAKDCDVSKVVEIYINDREIVDILREIERTYAEQEGKPNLAGAYGHNTPKVLYDNLSQAEEDELNGYEDGVELLRCLECGFMDCWSILVRIKQDEKYVYWYDIKHNHRDWNYDIAYQFDKNEYDMALQELKKEALVISETIIQANDKVR